MCNLGARISVNSRGGGATTTGAVLIGSTRGEAGGVTLLFFSRTITGSDAKVGGSASCALNSLGDVFGVTLTAPSFSSVLNRILLA